MWQLTMKQYKGRSLASFFRGLKRQWLFIFLGVLLGIVVASAYNFLWAEAEYASQTQIVVTPKDSDKDKADEKKAGLKTYDDLLHTPLILQPVAQAHQRDVETLSENTHLEADQKSAVFNVIVTDGNASQAQSLASDISEEFIQQLPQVLDVEKVTLLSPASYNENPVSPNYWLNLLLGAVLGGLVSLVIQAIRVLNDDTVRSQAVVEEMGWSLIGVLPQMSEESIEVTRFKRRYRSQDDNDETKRRI